MDEMVSVNYINPQEKITELNKNLLDVETLIQKKQISNYRAELEKIFLDAGEYYYKKIFIGKDFKKILNHVDECIKLEFSQIFGEIEQLLQQNQDKNIKNEFEKIILLLQQHYFRDILYNIDESKILTFKKNISEIETLFKPKQSLDKWDELSQVFIETKEIFFKKILKHANFKQIKNYIMNLKKFYLKKRLTEIEQLIQEKNFSIIHSELTELMIDAKRLNAYRNLKYSDFKKNIKKMNAWKKIVYENCYIEHYKLVKKKQFLKIFNELNDILADIERCNKEFKGYIPITPIWPVKKKIWEFKKLEKELNKIDLIKTIILDMGQKFPRIQVLDIIEKTGINDEELIIKTILEMIVNKEVYAEYFRSSKSILFNQQANLEEIDRLMENYRKWEEKKDGKI